MSIYEKIMVTKRIHYSLYWFLVGLLVFLIQQFFLQVIGETDHFWARLSVVIGGIGGILTLGIHMRRSLTSTLERLNGIIEPNISMSYKEWLEQEVWNIFSFTTWKARLIVPSMVITLTILFTFLLGWPFQSTNAKVIITLSLLPSFIICCHGTYIVYMILVLLSRIINFPLKVPFYRSNHPAIANLSKYFSRTSILVLVAYLWVIFTISLAPYGFPNPLLILITIVGFNPLTMFLWSNFQIHSLLQKIKDLHAGIINEQIQTTLKQMQIDQSKDLADLLAKLMEIQKKIEEARDWPINLEEIFTLLIAIGVPVANLALGYWRELYTP